MTSVSGFKYPNSPSVSLSDLLINREASHLIYKHRKRQQRQNTAQADELYLLAIVMDCLSWRPELSHTRPSR